MMELSALKFIADTTDLERAAKVISGLATDVSKLDKASRDAAQTEEILARAAKLNAEAHLQNAKAQDQRLKTTLTADKADQAQAATIEKKTKALEKETESTAKNVGILQKQKDILEFQTQGYSKGQSSILAYGKAAGLAAQDIEELGKVLETQRKLMGGDPFDKSLSGLKSLQNQYTELKESVRQYNTDSDLSSKQTRELARDKERLIEKMKVEGASFQDIRKAVRAHNDEYVSLAAQYNKLSGAEDAVVKNRKDIVSATNYVIQADQKMAAALNQSNAALDKGATDSLVKYESALRKSGLAQDVITQKLATYRTQLAQTQGAEEKRKAANLARALQPQFTDIGVSLYSGQSPLTVLLQQSGQMVDLFKLSGVEAQNLGKVMKEAFAGMLPAIGQVAKGLGSLVVESFLGAGRSITNFVGNITGITAAMEMAKRAIAAGGEENFKYIATLQKLGNIAAATSAILAGTLVLALVAMAIGLKQVISENNELAKSLTLNNGNLAITQTSAVEYVKLLSEMGVTTGKATEAISAMAKEGKFTRDEILLVGKASADMAKYADVAIEDTVKSFAKLKEKPVEGLIDLAQKTGMVSPEVIKLVIELEKQGKIAEATAISMKTLGSVTETQVAQMKENYNGFTLFIIELGSKIKQFFSDTFKVLFLATDPTQQLQDNLSKVQSRIKEVRENLEGNSKVLNFLGIGTDTKLLDSLKEQERQILKNIDRQVSANQVKEQEIALNVQNAKVLGVERELTDKSDKAIDKQKDKLLGLEEYRKKFVQDKLADYAKEKSIDIESLRGNEKILSVLKEQADVEFKKIHQKDGKQAARELDQYADILNKVNGLSSSYNNELTTLQKLRSQGRITEEQYVQAVEDLIKLQPFYIKQQKDINDAHELSNKLLGKQDLLGKDYYKTLEQIDKFEKMGIENGGYSVEQAEKLRQAAFDQTQLAKQQLKYVEDSTKNLIKYNAESQKSLDSSIIENQKLDDRIALLGLTTEQQKELRTVQQQKNELLKVEQDLTSQIAKIWEQVRQGKMDPFDAVAAQINAEKAAAEKVKVINKEVAVKFAEDFNAEMQKIETGISDSIVTALFEGGKAGSAKLRSVIIEALKKPVTIVVNAVVNALLNSVLGSLTGDSSGSTSTGSGSTLSSLGGLNGSITSAIGKGFTTFASSSVGQSLGLSSAVADEGAGHVALTSTGSTIGAGLGMLGNGLAGYGISSAISGGYSLGGGNTVNVIAGIASAFFGPIAGVIGGLINRAFGKKLDDTGVQGTFGGTSGFQGENYQYYKGGWFASDSTKTSEMDPALTKMLSDSFKAMQAQVGTFATVLGLSTDKIAGFTTTMKVSLMGLSQEDATKKIQEALATANNELAQQVIGTWKTTTEEVTSQVQNTAAEMEAGANAFSDVTKSVTKSTYVASEYAKEGEKAIDTLTRLATSLTTVNQVFDTLGYALLETGLKAADTASKLIDAFGGADAFVSSTSSFYQNFYSDTERQATTLRQLNDEFNKQNIALPKTREEYRKLVEAQDLSTDSGRAMYAFLVKLSPTFADITKSAADLAAAAADARKTAIESAYSALETAVNAQKDILQAQQTTVQAVVTNLQSIFDLLAKNVNELYMQVSSTSGMLASQGREVIGQALSSGVLPDNNTLSAAISSVRSSLDSNSYVTQFDQDKARLQFAADLKTLQDKTGVQLSTEQMILKGITDQLDTLDALLKKAREQADIAEGINKSVLSVADAIQALADAIKPKPAPTPAGGSGGAVFGGTSPGSASMPSEKSKYSQVTSMGTAGVGYIPITDTGYIAKLDSLSGVYHSFDGTGNLSGLLDAIKAAGGTMGDLSALSGFFESDWRKAASAVDIPAFATGGSYTGGMALVGEQGPELINFNRPGQVYNAAQTSQIMNSDTKNLADRVGDLEIALQTIAINTSKTTRLLQRVTRDGESLITKDYTLA